MPLFVRRQDFPAKFYFYNRFAAKKSNMDFVRAEGVEGGELVNPVLMSKDFLPTSAEEIAEVDRNYVNYRAGKPNPVPQRTAAIEVAVQDAPTYVPPETTGQPGAIDDPVSEDPDDILDELTAPTPQSALKTGQKGA